MSLPLLEHAAEGNPLIRLTPAGSACGVFLEGETRMPDRDLAAGEQYRFHFDMTKCIGCRCCEVACSEQNGNPSEIKWRRVGEVEGGSYPYTQRFYLSMGCNHCVDAACLKGCPVDAYRKDSVTGLVLHNADTCIGCGYCTWNCPYGVPQMNDERGVVGKCDMCHDRLADDREPACVNACPEGAIEIEIVNIAEWRQDHATGDAPGMPSAAHTISTTRITLPDNIPFALEKADSNRVQPEHPHWPLVVMLVLTQLSVGAFAYLSVLPAGQPFAALVAMLVGVLSLGAATLHLGRPVHFYRALKMWRRSWLSREALLFSLFAGAASAFAAVVVLQSFFAGSEASLTLRSLGWMMQLLPFATAGLGLAGITASAYIYIVPARPAWNSLHTLADFILTGFLLGPLFLASFRMPIQPAWIIAAAVLQIANQAIKYLSMRSSTVFELRASAGLLRNQLFSLVRVRLALLVLGVLLLQLAHTPLLGFAVVLAGEFVSRYLFFVSVVPKNMARSFLAHEEAA